MSNFDARRVREIFLMKADATQKTVPLDGFRKRNSIVAPFRQEKIEQAVRRAAEAVARNTDVAVSPDIARKIAGGVVAQLNHPASEYYVHPEENGQRIPCIEDVQDLVELLLAENGETMILGAYKRYRKKRELARRRIRVRDASKGGPADVTDAGLLLVESATQNLTLPWDHHRIVDQLLRTTSLPAEEAIAVAKAVENWLIESDIQTVNSTLIRELVNNELMVRGKMDQLRDLSLYRVPRDFMEKLMATKSSENSNIVNNNPEAVNLGIAELVLKQWALDTMFGAEIKRAHDTGAIHVHDLGYPHRVYCSSHSIEYVKKYGLRKLVNLNTFLASMQANYAGALGIAYINVFYAPYLEGMDEQTCKQMAQELIFNGSQNAFSRGGQTLFLDFNIHTGVPAYLRSVPAIGPGGRYMLRLADGRKAPLEEELRRERDAGGYPLMDLYHVDGHGQRRLALREIDDGKGGTKLDPAVEAALHEAGEAIVTYGDYIAESQAFCRALLEVWAEGDRNGRVFEFPKCDFHVSEETFEDPAQYELYLQACELASRNGSTYFVFDRDEVTLSACCRLRTTIEDSRMLRHPECMRFCGFQNVTINIPQAAYRAAQRDGDSLLETFHAELERAMELATQAHLQKKAKIHDMMRSPGQPLWQIGQESCDGKPYVDLDACTYILGLIGLNDAVNFLIGQELHESPDAMKLGLKIVARMYLKAQQLSRRHNLKLTLEESPAESAARRLAKTDLVYFPREARDIVKGDNEDVVYYTNSIHLAAEADVSLTERLRQQAKFHSMIESGAMTHAFVGEERPSAASVARLMKQALFRTQCAQATISPEFTYCNRCNHNMRGLEETCLQCGSDDVVGETRVVGYFSKIQNWNKSKRYGELLARHRGRYSVETADDDSVPRSAMATA